MSGVKHDGGKDPWHLLPYDAIRCIVKVLAFGADKYAARNWESGMDWSRPYAALMRHLTLWWEGEKSDPETGYSHLWHAGCCIVFLIAYELRGIGKDDRPVLEEGAPVAPGTKAGPEDSQYGYVEAAPGMFVEGRIIHAHQYSVSTTPAGAQSGEVIEDGFIRIILANTDRWLGVPLKTRTAYQGKNYLSNSDGS